MRKPLLTLAVAGASAAGLAVMGPTIAGALDSTTTTTNPSAKTAPPAGAPTPADRAQKLRDILKPLVDKGTITQAQADAVVNALQAAGPQGMGGGMGGGGGRHGGGMGPRGAMGAKLDAAAKALGMTADDLRAALQKGQTLAQVAQSKGVAVQKVIDAIVADIRSTLDTAVKAGRMTQAQADQLLATAKERVIQQVNGQGGPGVMGRRFDGFDGFGGGRDGMRGPGGHRMGRGFHAGGGAGDARPGAAQGQPAASRVARV